MMTADQLDKCPVRDRSGESAPTKADQIPPLEIRAAASLVIAESGEMPREDLIVAIARILVFVKTGKDLKEKIDQSLPREFL